MAVIGRKVLYATRPETLDWQSVGAILKSVIASHRENAGQIRELQKFRLGDQPVERSEATPGLASYDIVENRAYEAVAFKVGYELSNPVQFVSASTDKKKTKKSKYIDMLNKFAKSDGQRGKDIAVADSFFTTGVGYKKCLAKVDFDGDSAPYITTVLEPDETFVVYDKATGVELIAGQSVMKKVPSTDNEYQYRTGVFTDTEYFEWSSDDEWFEDFDTQPPEITDVNGAPIDSVNGIGLIPITEYMNESIRVGCFEPAMDLLTAMNALASNRMEGVENIVRSILVIINAAIEKDENGNPKFPPVVGGTIMIGNNVANVDAKFISAVLDQLQAQTLKDDWLRAFYRIVGMPTPGNQGQAQSGGSTGQAEFVRNDWGLADTRANPTLILFQESEMKQLRIRLAICRKIKGVDIGDLTLHDVDVKTTRNKFANILTNSQALLTLLRTGISLEDALWAADIFPDNLAVALRAATKAAQEKAEQEKSKESEYRQEMSNATQEEVQEDEAS